ncbi:MAG: primosomal protein N' [Dehalococcoidia bacterium]
MSYAEVAVDAPVSHSRTFSYSIPDRFDLKPGHLVWVPFGRRILQGVVVELAQAPQVEVTRDILQVVEGGPLVSEAGLELGRWISRYYLCSLFDALSLLLPPGFRAQVRSLLSSDPAADPDSESLRPQTREALLTLVGSPRMNEREFTKLLGRNGVREVSRLVERGWVHRRVDLPRPRTFKYESNLVAVSSRVVVPEGPEAESKVSPRQQDLLRAVREHGEGYPTALANKEFGAGVGNALVDKGLLALEWVRQDAPVLASLGPVAAPPNLTLTPQQADCLAQINQALEDPQRQPRSFLLHGVTGSGKTEVYLRAIQRAVERGQQAIFLVPEIALTPQTVERVSARFPDRVAVLHSGLRDRQKFDQWWKIRDGEYDVVVGPRSALFAPVSRLGLIVIDEEHEWTYKQEEFAPLYHTRTVALELSRRTGAVVVLGSATPDVETYYRATRGRHRLLELPQRIGAAAGSAPVELAPVKICDMRQELREGNRSIFSRELAAALKECARRGQQAILFLNRRGSASIVQCRDCGHVVVCPRCSVSLTYHSDDGRLVCHRCNRRSRVPRTCRQCRSGRIRQLGIGTQRVVEEVRALIPGVRVDRWDADASRTGPGPEETMRRLASGETQVLVGTQMVAKGLDVPNVTLVGVILADIGLHLPDFRVGERNFSLMCQVAGRAGRGPASGRVIIQTYNPDHYAVVAAARQDYAALYRQEIAARREQGNPPFNQLVHLVHQEVNQTAGQQQITALGRLLRQRVRAQGLADVEVIGPAPGMPARVRGHYRWHLLLRGRNLHRFLEGVSIPKESIVDVDPAHVL